MPESQDAKVIGKGRWLIWLALLLYAACFFSRRTLSGPHHFLNHPVPDYLLSGTLFLFAFLLHISGLMTSAYYRRSALTWISAAMLVVGGAMLVRDWIHLLT